MPKAKVPWPEPVPAPGASNEVIWGLVCACGHAGIKHVNRINIRIAIRFMNTLRELTFVLRCWAGGNGNLGLAFGRVAFGDRDYPLESRDCLRGRTRPVWSSCSPPAILRIHSQRLSPLPRDNHVRTTLTERISKWRRT